MSRKLCCASVHVLCLVYGADTPRDEFERTLCQCYQGHVAGMAEAILEALQNIPNNERNSVIAGRAGAKMYAVFLT